MPTVFVNWTGKRSPSVLAEVAAEIARAIVAVPESQVFYPEHVLVYFDELSAGDLYVDGKQYHREGDDA